MSFTIVGVQYLYPGPTHDSYLSTTRHNFWPKRKYSEFKITWTLIFPFLQSPTCFVPAPIIAFVVICWRYLKKVDSSVAFESADTDLHAIDPLMTWSRELLSPYESTSKFWCKHMPSNFGIKVILFQNYHVCMPDRSAVMGKESWSGVYYLSLSMPAHEPMLQKLLWEHHCFTGTWIHPSRPAIKCLSDPVESNSTIQPCFSSICFLECSRLRWTLHGLSFCYEDLERFKEFLCIGWLCRSF